MSSLTNRSNRFKGFCKFLIIVIAAAFVTGGCFAINSLLSNPDTSTITFNICQGDEKGIIERVYGEPLDLSDVTISYQNNKREHVTIAADQSMVSNYDSETIGNQDITLTYCGVSKTITVYTSPRDIQTPRLELNGSSLFWNTIPNSSGYQINYGKSADSLDYLCDSSSNSYDLSSFENSGYCYFSVKALKVSEKYSDSNWSNVLKTLILGKVNNINYQDGALNWDFIDYANSYTVEINGEKHIGISENYYEIPFTTGEYKVKVYAYSNQDNSIYSESDLFNFSMLGGISEVNCLDGYLNWNQVENANSYDVYVNGSLYAKTSIPKLDITDFEPGIYEFRIATFSNDPFFLQPTDYCFKALLNYGPNFEDGTMNWERLNGESISYHLVIDGKEESLPNGDFKADLNSYLLTPGEHTFAITIYSNSKILLNTSNSLILKKLKKPILSFKEGKVVADDSSRTLKLFRNGEEFDGKATSIHEAGNSLIAGKYLAMNDSEIDSDLSDDLKVVKLPKPILSIENGLIVPDDPSRKVIYYLDGEVFDGNLSNIIEEGKHSITAAYISTSDMVLDSDSSDSLTIVKLPKPQVSVESKQIKVNPAFNNVDYYLDGIQFDGDYESIATGRHLITAKNVGDGTTKLDSELSDPFAFYKSDVVIAFSKSSNNRGYITLKTQESSLLYDMTIEYYKDGNLINSQLFEDKNLINSPQMISYSRSGVIADQINVIVSIKNSDCTAQVTSSFNL